MGRQGDYEALILMQFSVISTALLGLFYFDEIPSGLQVMGSRIIMFQISNRMPPIFQFFVLPHPSHFC